MRPTPATAEKMRRQRLEATVRVLADDIGPRNLHHYDGLTRAADFVEHAFAAAGYAPTRQSYTVRDRAFANILAERTGRSDEVVLVGAHYDTHAESPGANDNGSAVATLVELAQGFARKQPMRTVRFAAFTNEEAPFTRTRDMGSYRYAADCRARGDAIVGIICLDTIGCRCERAGSQRLSFGGLLLPRRGNFLAIVANRGSRKLLDEVSRIFRSASTVPIQPWALPSFLPGPRSSDQWSFWQHGFPGILVTDTALLRYKAYHTRGDTAEKLDYGWLEAVVEALESVVVRLAACES